MFYKIAHWHTGEAVTKKILYSKRAWRADMSQLVSHHFFRFFAAGVDEAGLREAIRDDRLFRYRPAALTDF